MPEKKEPRYDAGREDEPKLDNEGRDLRFRETIPSSIGPNVDGHNDMAASAHDPDHDPDAPAREAEKAARRPEA
jgi:hypothetical protein